MQTVWSYKQQSSSSNEGYFEGGYLEGVPTLAAFPSLCRPTNPEPTQ